MLTNIHNDEMVIYSQATRRMSFTQDELEHCLVVFHDHILLKKAVGLIHSLGAASLSAGISGLITVLFSDARSICNIPSERMNLVFICVSCVLVASGLILLALSFLWQKKYNAVNRHDFIAQYVANELNKRTIKSPINWDMGVSLQNDNTYKS